VVLCAEGEGSSLLVLNKKRGFTGPEEEGESSVAI